MKQIILASASPRRKELLEQIRLEFEIIPAKGEEVITKTAPEEVVMELSRQKAIEVAGMVGQFSENHGEIMTPQDMLVIGADTVVAAKNEAGKMEILGKPKDDADAYRMLSMLSGKVHSVYTGVTLVFLDKSGKAGAHTFYEKTTVFLSSDGTISYLAQWELGGMSYFSKEELAGLDAKVEETVRKQKEIEEEIA